MELQGQTQTRTNPSKKTPLRSTRCRYYRPSSLMSSPSSPSSHSRFSSSGFRNVTVFVTALVVACLGGGRRGAEAVSSGAYHSCSVFDDGTVKCWGLNANGQLGLDDHVNRGSLQNTMGDWLPEVNLGVSFVPVGVSCGLDHSCAWSTTGRIKCWGGNAYGQLGYGDTVDRGGVNNTMSQVPAVTLGGTSVSFVVAANHFTCVLFIDQTVSCFGRNDWGQVGTGNGRNNVGDEPNEMGTRLARVKLGAWNANITVTALSAHNSPCVIVESVLSDEPQLKCWGANGYGNLGIGDDFNRGDNANEMGTHISSTYLGKGEVPVQVTTGMDLVCVLLESGNVKCWGRNPNGQCGLGTILTFGDDSDEMGDNLPYVDLGTNRTAVSVSAGDAHVCAILDNASVKCWGKGYYGQLGTGSWKSIGQVPGEMGDSLAAIDLGTSTSRRRHRNLRLRNGNERNNSITKLFLSSTKRGGAGSGAGAAARRVLQQSASSSDVEVESLALGGQRSCAIIDGGSVKCWGRAFAGGLGSGGTADVGDREGSMGDSLALLSLGTGKVSVSPSPFIALTSSPTRAPTSSPTTAPTMEPTLAPTLNPTPAPSLGPTIAPTVPLTRSPFTPSPSTSAPTAALALSRNGFEDFMGDVGISLTQGYIIAVGIPLALLFFCCCFGCACASKRKKRNDIPDEGNFVSSSSDHGSIRKGGTAAQIAPVSHTHSRKGSRSGGFGSRAASFYGVDGSESLMSDRDGVLYAPGGKMVGVGPGADEDSKEANAFHWEDGMERAGFATGIFAAAAPATSAPPSGNVSINGSSDGRQLGPFCETGAGVARGGIAEGGAETAKVPPAEATISSVLSNDSSDSTGNLLGSENNGGMLGKAKEAKNTPTPPLAPIRRISAETPPETWDEKYQVKTVSGSVNPDSSQAGSVTSSRNGGSRALSHRRSGSAANGSSHKPAGASTTRDGQAGSHKRSGSAPVPAIVAESFGPSA